MPVALKRTVDQVGQTARKIKASEEFVILQVVVQFVSAMFLPYLVIIHSM